MSDEVFTGRVCPCCGHARRGREFAANGLCAHCNKPCWFVWGAQDATLTEAEPACDRVGGHEWTDHHVNPNSTHIHSTCEHCPWVKVTPRAR